MARILGAPLFEVLGKKVALTTPARIWSRTPPRRGAGARDLRGLRRAARAGPGAVRLGASTSMGTYVLPPCSRVLVKSYPRVGITLEILNTAHIEDSCSGTTSTSASWGTRRRRRTWRGSSSSRTRSSSPLPGPPAGDAAARSHPAHRPRAAHRPGAGVGDAGARWRRTCSGRGAVFPSMMQLGAVEAMKQAVMSGLGISYFSALTVRRELRGKRLVRLPVRGLLLPRCFLFVHRRDKRPTPGAGRPRRVRADPGSPASTGPARTDAPLGLC